MLPLGDLLPCPVTLAECIRLLRSQSIGRLVYTDNALPAVRPVGFIVPGGHLVIRCGSRAWARRLDWDLFLVIDREHVTGRRLGPPDCRETVPSPN